MSTSINSTYSGETLNDTIKIIYIIDCFKDPYAGTEGQLLKLIEGLNRKEFTPILLILRDSFYYKNVTDPVCSSIPIPADILNISSLSSVRSWITLYKYFRNRRAEGFTIAHTYFYDAAMICPPLLKILGYKILVSRRDMGYWYTKMNIWILRFNAFLVDRVVANSEAVKAITVSKERYRPNKVNVIYNGYQEVDKNKFFEKSSIPFNKNELRIVLVANIRPIKRIYDAILAIRIINEAMLNVALYVIGGGDHLDLENLALQNGLKKKVHFIGSRDDILNLLPLFDVGILCSESEGFSNTVIEYFQSSLPVICSNVGGNPEIVEDGVNGFLYEVGDIQMLASNIVKLAQDETLRLKMGQLGMEKVRNNYSLEKYLANHEQLYNELVLG